MKKFLAILAVVMMSSSMAAKPKEIEGPDGLTQKDREIITNPEYNYKIDECSVIEKKYKRHQYGNILLNGSMKCYVKKGIVSTNPVKIVPLCSNVEKWAGGWNKYCKQHDAEGCKEASGKIKPCLSFPTCEQARAKHGTFEKYCENWENTEYMFSYCSESGTIKECPKK